MKKKEVKYKDILIKTPEGQLLLNDLNKIFFDFFQVISITSFYNTSTGKSRYAYNPDKPIRRGEVVNHSYFVTVATDNRILDKYTMTFNSTEADEKKQFTFALQEGWEDGNAKRMGYYVEATYNEVHNIIMTHDRDVKINKVLNGDR